jgi:hypothetical protein
MDKRLCLRRLPTLKFEANRKGRGFRRLEVESKIFDFENHKARGVF